MHPLIKQMLHRVPLPVSRQSALTPQSYSKLSSMFRQFSSSPVTNIIQKNSSIIRSLEKNINGVYLKETKLNPFSAVGVSRFHSDHDRTTVTVLNKEEGAPLMVDSFSESGFRLNNGLAVVGSIALFPKSLLSWNVSSAEAVTEDSLALFYMLSPKISLLILGIGDYGNKINMRLLPFMRDKGVSLEVLPTEKAVSTFNFLNAEGRSVAGAFIPPSSVAFRDDEYAEARDRKKELFQSKLPDEFL